MRRGPLAAVLAVTVVALGGCTSPDTSPVPVEADEPYVCDGVPQRGAELILGGEVTAEQTGSWPASGPAFSCTADRSGGRVFVTYGDPYTFLSLETAQDQQDAEPIEADVEGEGVLFGDSKATAMWVCGDHVLAVELIDVQTEGRDRRDDARNLLVSMLPWGCDGADVPVAT